MDDFLPYDARLASRDRLDSPAQEGRYGRDDLSSGAAARSEGRSWPPRTWARIPPSTEAQWDSRQTDPERPGLAAFLRYVLSSWRMLLASAALAALLAGVYLVLTTPQYTSTALLFIDTKTAAGLRSNTPAMTDANVESANIESQVELLRSEHIVRKLVESERLVMDPALAPGFVAKTITDLKTTAKEWTDAVLHFFGRQEGRVSQGWGHSPTAEDQVTAATRALQKRIYVRRIGLTYAVEVSATMPDPFQAARVANAYANVFIADQANRREETARNISRMLEARTAELQAQTQEAERRVEELKFSGSLQGESSATARVTLRNLESTAQTFRVLHDKFLERSAETWQQQFLSLPDAQLASTAYPPSSKSSPRTLVVLAAALFIGLAIGLLRLILRDGRLLGLRV